MFEEEISPEEMFRQFFGGGGMGPFGPGFGMFILRTFKGVRITRFPTFRRAKCDDRYSFVFDGEPIVVIAAITAPLTNAERHGRLRPSFQTH